MQTQDCSGLVMVVAMLKGQRSGIETIDEAGPFRSGGILTANLKELSASRNEETREQ